MSERETAGGELGLIQAFVNTVDLDPGVEELKDPNTLRAWLVANKLMPGHHPVDDSDLKNALAVREAMRGVIGGNSALPIYPVDLATLNSAAAASRLRMRFAPDGRPRLEPEASGAVGAIGRLVAALYSAMQDEEWERLKLCGSGTCRWAFYDREPLVQHGLLRQPREGAPLQTERNGRVRTTSGLNAWVSCTSRS